MLRGQLIKELVEETKEDGETKKADQETKEDREAKKKEKMSFHDGCPTCMELVKEPIRERD